MLVFKFGGTSVSSKDAIDRVIGIIKNNEEKGLVVVISALDGITEKLLELCSESRKGNVHKVRGIIRTISNKHIKLASSLLKDENLIADIKNELENLEFIAVGSALSRELTKKASDRILSFGEILSTKILCRYAMQNSIKCRYYTGGEAGIITDENFGNAVPMFELSYLLVREKLQEDISKSIIPFVTGFIARTQHGEVSTLGRGGSDLTATIIGAALGAEEVCIWSDVDGLMTADPRIVKEARVIEKLTYSEAQEMAMLGAKSMHPRTLEPALSFNIPVRFRNTFNLSSAGTLVSSKGNAQKVKAVLLVRDVSCVTVKGASMVGRIGTAGAIFDCLAKAGINIMMISQAVSESNISFVVKKKDGRKAVSSLELGIAKELEFREIKHEDNVAVVSVVGENMRGTPGIASRVFSSLARKGINVKMISQGSSELNISLVVDEREAEEAVRAVHSEFELGKLK